MFASLLTFLKNHKVAVSVGTALVGTAVAVYAYKRMDSTDAEVAAEPVTPAAA